MDEAPLTHETPILAVRLTPHRSLDPAAVRVLLAATFVVTAIFSLPFYLMGAWPIVGFLGLDVLALFLAFRANFRAARAYEDFLRIDPSLNHEICHMLDLSADNVMTAAERLLDETEPADA